MRMILACSLALTWTTIASAQEMKSADLRTTIERMGYEPKDLDNDLFEIDLDRDNWQVFVTVSVSRDGKYVWLDTKFPEVPNPELAPPTAFLRLLQENANVAPCFFSYNKSDSRVHIYRALDNKGITPAQLQREITQFDRNIRSTVDLWRPEAFKPVVDGPGSTPRPMPPAVNTDRARVLGVWKVIGIELNGTRLGEDELADKQLTLTFADAGTMTIKQPDKPDDVATFVVDGTTNPKSINVTNKEGKLEKGIFRITGDTMELCYANPGGERPTRFEAPSGFNGGMFILRKSGGGGLNPMPMPPVVNLVDREKNRFLGKWKVTSITLNGTTLGDAELANSNMTLTFEKDKMTIRRDGAEDDVTTWVIDPKPSPPNIDITNKEGRLEKTIYKFEGNTLTLCFADPGFDRPTKFEAPEGFRGGVIVLKK